MRTGGAGRAWVGWIVAAGIAALPAAGRAAPSNYEFVRQSALAACQSLVKAMPAGRSDSLVAIGAVGTSPANFLVENTLATALTEAGWQVRTEGDSMLGAAVEFEVVDLGLAYPRVHRRAVFGEKRIEREARARIFARLVDRRRGEVFWADQSESRLTDEVSADELRVLEEKNPADYVKATMPPDRWNKLVEPIVVTSIIAGLIILFFANQSTE